MGRVLMVTAVRRSIESVFPFIDFEKGFAKFLKVFNFCPRFTKWVLILYNDVQCAFFESAKVVPLVLSFSLL